MNVTLSEFEITFVEYVAKQRHDACRNANIFNNRRSQYTDMEIEVAGVGAEQAVAKMFNVYNDWSLHPRSAEKGTDLGDLMINNLVVDVKAVMPQTLHPRLSVKKKKSFVDLFCLVRSNHPHYEILGFFPCVELFIPSRLHTWSSGDQSYLAEVAELMDFARAEYLVTKHKRNLA